MWCIIFFLIVLKSLICLTLFDFNRILYTYYYLCMIIRHFVLVLEHCVCFSEGEVSPIRDQEKLDLVELLEAVTYLVCQDHHVLPDSFHKVRTTTSYQIPSMRSESPLPIRLLHKVIITMSCQTTSIRSGHHFLTDYFQKVMTTTSCQTPSKRSGPYCTC